MADYVEFLGKKRRTMPKYPRVDMMIHHRGTLKQFLAETGVTENVYKSIQHGDSNPRKMTIDAILAYTGLTYEQAFGREANFL